MQLDGPCLEAGPGSLSEMHLTRVVSLGSLLQILHFRPVPPGFIPTGCCMAWWQSGHQRLSGGHISKTAKKLQPSQASRCVNHHSMQTPVLLQFRCQSTKMLVTLMTIHSQEGSLLPCMHWQQHGHATTEQGACGDGDEFRDGE
jgi:hypothetical protein